MTDLAFGLIEEEMEELDRKIFLQARTLVRDPVILAHSLDATKNPHLSRLINAELPNWVLQDDTESIGRSLTDCIIEYVMELAEEGLELSAKSLH